MKNLIFLTTLAIILHTSLFSQYCLPDGIVITAQSQIDNFQAEHPNCTMIQGNVNISGPDIENLNGLNLITLIEGDLVITDTPNLNDLSGLNNLNSIIGALAIWKSHALVNLSGLDNLSSVGTLIMWNNDNLTSLEGMNILSTIEIRLEIRDMDALTDLSGLENVTSIGVGENLYCLEIIDNDNLISLSGLNNISTLQDGIYFSNNDALTDISALNNLGSIDGDLIIRVNETLSNLSGFENLFAISGSLTILRNHNINDLSGLNNLRSVGKDLSINKNNTLISLEGLENLISIGGELEITENNLLESLIGIENLNAETINKLSIYENDSLSSCAVKSICDFLAAPNGEIDIHENYSGCNNREEVEEVCILGIFNGLINQHAFSIYPNPARNEISITSHGDLRINEVIIYNQLGQKVLIKVINTDKIDLSTIEQGIYIIEIIINNQSTRKKLIVN